MHMPLASDVLAAGPLKPAACPVSLPRAMASAVIEGAVAVDLAGVRDGTTGLTLWRRPIRVALCRAAGAMVSLGPFCVTVEGSPARVSRALIRMLPFRARLLQPDIAFLGRLFAAVAGVTSVRFRLELVTDDSCHRYHVDAVRLRLLCTYFGRGTEWIDPMGGRRRMPPFQVGIFKGLAFPDAAPRILHRSPPVDHLRRSRRSRLLLCIDEPGSPA
jgi:Protein of unknown function (DUF1826)